MELIEKAPAKINLSLDALYRHADGEHEWQMVMTSVDLADYVSIKPSHSIQVSTDSGFLPEDPRNLAYKAALALQRHANIRQGARIHIEKHIPVAAGLGGGSSDAAAVLRGLNSLWQLGYSRSQLARIGLQVDSDVPYCVYSETALVTGRGDVVTPLEVYRTFGLFSLSRGCQCQRQVFLMQLTIRPAFCTPIHLKSLPVFKTMISTK